MAQNLLRLTRRSQHNKTRGQTALKMKLTFSTNRNHRLCSPGFTLIEVLVATVIMLFMFVSFYAAISEGISVMQVAREDIRATQIMDNHMEGIRLFTWDQLTNTTLLPTNFIENYYPSGNQGFNYTGAVTVANVGFSNPSSSYSNNIYQITIQLTWQSTGPLHTRQMTTYCAKYGIQNYVWSSN